MLNDEMSSTRQNLILCIALRLVLLPDFMKPLTLSSRNSMPLQSSGVSCKNAFVALVRLLVTQMCHLRMKSLFSDAVCPDKEGRKLAFSRIIPPRFIGAFII